jgi:hypothetical protein
MGSPTNIFSLEYKRVQILEAFHFGTLNKDVKTLKKRLKGLNIHEALKKLHTREE